MSREAGARYGRDAWLEVLRPGPLTTVQDLGREGNGAIGVGSSGAADRGSARLANRMVGNGEGAAVLEATLGGLLLRCHAAVTLAVTGAPCPVEVAGRGEAAYCVLRVPAGASVRLGTPSGGLRSYLAVRGGIDVAPVLGSRSTDRLSGLGPAPLEQGSVLPVGTDMCGFPVLDAVPPPTVPSTRRLRVVPGPRADWFAPQALRNLLDGSYEVTEDSDRIGMRLRGPSLERRGSDELPSEGVATGALQVPPSGQPTLFLTDHPVTGGYPVIGVLLSEDIDRAAQARPGDQLRFRAVDGPGSAHAGAV